MRKAIIPYNPKLKELAKKLRQEATFSEVLLWNEIKRGKMLGYDFDRQKPLDNFVVDFYCQDLYLAIEVDGDSHDFDKDEIRQARLESFGVKFLRFDDKDIKQRLPDVLNIIHDWILDNAPGSE
jgi:very-short-patch-repair endonuclease